MQLVQRQNGSLTTATSATESVSATCRVEEPPVDLRARHKAVDVDCVGAFDLDGLQLLVLDEEELAFADLVAAALVVGIDRVAGLLVDELLAQPVSGLAVDLAEGNPLR